MAGQGKLAYKIRTGLTVVEGKKAEVRKGLGEPGVLDELYFRKPIRQHVREFAGILAIIFLFFTGLRLYRGSSLDICAYLAGAALLVLVLGYKFPKVLYPVWKGFMAVAEKIGHFITLVIVTIAWCTVTVPFSVLLKLLKKDLMDMSFRTDAPTYFEDRKDEENDFKLLERQF